MTQERGGRGKGGWDQRPNEGTGLPSDQEKLIHCKRGESRELPQLSY